LLLHGRGMWDIVQVVMDRWFALGALYKRNSDGTLQDMLLHTHRAH